VSEFVERTLDAIDTADPDKIRLTPPLFSSLLVCAFAGNPNVFLGLESVWPEKMFLLQVYRKDAVFKDVPRFES
jgi:hypothetical protein